MPQTSRSKVAMLPVFIFIVVPILAFVFLRKYGFIFFALFFNPIGAVIGQMFTIYKIENNQLIINGIFKNKTIPIDSIQFVHTQKANLFQQLISGLPDTYQSVGYNQYNQEIITPIRELEFNSSTHQLYFQS